MKELIIRNTEAGQNLFRYLLRVLPDAPSGILRKSLRKKNITLNGRKAEGKEILQEGDTVRVWFSEETWEKFSGAGKTEKETESPDFPFSFQDMILYEDENILILNKPAGLLSQRDGSGAPSLNDGVLSYLKDVMTPAFRPSVCNRLDRNTSGLVLAGKHLPALQMLNGLLKDRTLRKYYVTILFGTLTGEKTVKGYLIKDKNSNRSFLYRERKDGAVPIETRYRVLRNFTAGGIPLTLAEAHLVTGRSHQLRLHFASLGHPILGDRKYGSRESIEASKALSVPCQLLHAERIIFPHLEAPFSSLSGREWKAPLPEKMKKLLP